MDVKLFRYIIRFLLGDDVSPDILMTIGYTADRSLFHRFNVVIIPSGFFHTSCYGRTDSIPSLPLQEIEGIPLLFGTPETEKIGATLVVKADIIASTYFLITRYEEIIRRNARDTHGRFPGKESLPYRAGFIDRPIVDEYRVLLRRWLQQTCLRVPDVKKKIRTIWLTHDVDAPFLYRSWKGMVRSLRDGRGIKQSLSNKFSSIEEDPYYTFPWIFRLEEQLLESIGKKRCRTVYFFRGGGRTNKDKPHYNLCNNDMQQLLKAVLTRKSLVGLHTSYEAGKKPALIKKEKQNLEKAISKKVTYNRHHFLSCREPEDMLQLEAAGITDDFTMGYADVAGFRLGTAWPVRWINPVNRRLSPMVLHPLHIMEATIEDQKYMGLPYEEGEAYCKRIIERIEETGGELSLLWHNQTLAGDENSYQRRLYTALIHKLSAL